MTCITIVWFESVMLCASAISVNPSQLIYHSWGSDFLFTFPDDGRFSYGLQGTVGTLGKCIQSLFQCPSALFQIGLSLCVLDITIHVQLVSTSAEHHRRQGTCNERDEICGKVCGGGRCEAQLTRWRLTGEWLPWSGLCTGNMFRMRGWNCDCVSRCVNFLRYEK